MGRRRRNEGELVLTRWSIRIQDYVASDTLRAMSGDGEMLWVRLCLDQFEHGAAHPSEERWRRAHGGRCHDFAQAWREAVATGFELTPAGLVHPDVDEDRRRALAEIAAKRAGADKTNARKGGTAERTLSARPPDGQRTLIADSSSSSPSSEDLSSLASNTPRAHARALRTVPIRQALRQAIGDLTPED